MDAIRTENLTRVFGDTAAVDKLTFSVAEGELFGLVGPDGAGKTTTMRLLTSAMDPTSGDAWVAGHHTVREGAAIKHSIGCMGQRSGLYPDLTVMENLDFYADIYGVPRGAGRDGKIDRLLTFGNLLPFKKRLAGNLSGGMKQKLGLACALIHTPRVLFLDEPTNGVDPVSRRDLWNILRQLLDEGVTVFISTAYLDEAERCTRLALINQGRLMALGTPGEVRQLMRDTILDVRATEPRRAAALLRANLPGCSVGLFGDRIHVATGDAVSMRNKAETLLRGAGIVVADMQRTAPTLEDVFISVVAREEPKMIAMPAQAGGVAIALPSMSGPAVRVENLEKRFGSFVAVNRVSFEVGRGEVFGFLGPNGAGKSTTIRMLCGILSPSGGSGTVAGLDIRTRPEAIKASIGYMSQKFSLYEDLTVEENIDFYSGIYRIPAERKAERKEWVIEMAGLRDQRNLRTGVLSSGWKQRLSLGCAILHAPPVIFLDEPTAGVDPISRRRFWDLIYGLAEGGVTVFVTTHYMDEAEYCDRIALIYRGELVAMDAPAALKTPSMPTMEDVFVSLIEAHDRAEQPRKEMRE